MNRHVEQSVTQSFGFKSSTLGLPSFIDGIAPSFPEIQPQSYSALGAQDGSGQLHHPANSVDQFGGFHQDERKASNSRLDLWTCGLGSTAATTQTRFCNSKPHPQPDRIRKIDGGNRATDSPLSCWAWEAAQIRPAITQFPATDKHLLGWYLQDGWKVTPKLTLNLGLRYEIQTAPTERT